MEGRMEGGRHTLLVLDAAGAVFTIDHHRCHKNEREGRDGPRHAARTSPGSNVSIHVPTPPLQASIYASLARAILTRVSPHPIKQDGHGSGDQARLQKGTLLVVVSLIDALPPADPPHHRCKSI
jgi:hypothetical protein